MKPKTAVLMCLLIVLATATATAQQRETPPVAFSKISDRLYEVTGGSGAHGGMYIGDNGVLLIDTKMNEESMKQVFDGLRKLTDKPVVYLVNTHADGDHVRGNRYVPESTVVVSHENCRSEFFHASRNGGESEWSDPALAPFLPEITYSDRMIIHLGSKKVELYHFGVGHTTGDTVVYFPEENVAFIGDQYFGPERAPLIHAYKGGSALGNIANLERMLAALDAKTYYTGHADPVTPQMVRDHIGRMNARVKKVKDMADKGASVDDVKKASGEGESDLAAIIYAEVKAGK